MIVNAFSARVGIGFGISFLNIGSGIIIGLRISASMFIGGVIGWVLAPPWLLSHGLIAADAKRVDILLHRDVVRGRHAGGRRHHGTRSCAGAC